jgi:hypothetical protein
MHRARHEDSIEMFVFDECARPALDSVPLHACANTSLAGRDARAQGLEINRAIPRQGMSRRLGSAAPPTPAQLTFLSSCPALLTLPPAYCLETGELLNYYWVVPAGGVPAGAVPEGAVPEGAVPCRCLRRAFRRSCRCVRRPWRRCMPAVPPVSGVPAVPAGAAVPAVPPVAGAASCASASGTGEPAKVKAAPNPKSKIAFRREIDSALNASPMCKSPKFSPRDHKKASAIIVSDVEARC